ncbi:MAG: hypothetical protein OXH60_13965 [Rhodospirillales bacterium]|nr:hypothetical protein [Rhodospirillales bacterium]
MRLFGYFSLAVFVGFGFAHLVGDPGDVSDPPVQEASESVSRPAPPPPPPDLLATVRDTMDRVTGVDRVTDIDVLDSVDPPGEKIVHVTFLASENLTTGFTKSGIESAMRDGYEAAFTHSKPVQLVTMAVHMTLVDRFGNESVELVYGTRMESDIAGRINWENKHGLEFDRLWTVYWLHPVFK